MLWQRELVVVVFAVFGLCPVRGRAEWPWHLFGPYSPGGVAGSAHRGLSTQRPLAMTYIYSLQAMLGGEMDFLMGIALIGSL